MDSKVIRERQRYKLVKELFLNALTFAEDEREIYLTQACSGDIELLQEVRRWLISSGHLLMYYKMLG
ncbi:MAG: hypothetical protein AB1489_18440 [Acidobacteriota bacterium]